MKSEADVDMTAWNSITAAAAITTVHAEENMPLQFAQEPPDEPPEPYHHLTSRLLVIVSSISGPCCFSLFH